MMHMRSNINIPSPTRFMSLNQFMSRHEVIFGDDALESVRGRQLARMIERVAGNIIILEKFTLQIL